MEFGEIMQNNGDCAVQDISKITYFGTNGKPMCDFLYVNNSNLPRILHRFRDTVDYLSNFCCRQGMPIFYALVRGKPPTFIAKFTKSYKETRNIPLLYGMKSISIS